MALFLGRPGRRRRPQGAQGAQGDLLQGHRRLTGLIPALSIALRSDCGGRNIDEGELKRRVEIGVLSVDSVQAAVNAAQAGDIAGVKTALRMPAAARAGGA